MVERVVAQNGYIVTNQQSKGAFLNGFSSFNKQKYSQSHHFF
jgi:hypothetical protein